MKTGRIISAVCAAVMCLGCMAGCSNDDSSSNGDKEDTKTYYNGEDIDTGWTWGNAQIVGGGFIPGIVYNPTEQDVAYVRTDMGGAYRWDKEAQQWDCITDCIGAEDWNLNGIESVATDPVEPNRVYLACGTYSTQGNGAIFVSEDYGSNWVKVDLPFGLGGNEVGRGAGERLAVDPNDNSIIYFGTRSSGLYRSTDYGMTWEEVTSFPTKGTYNSDGYALGVTWVAFDKASSESGKATQTIFVGAAVAGEDNVFRSDDGGETWTAIQGSNPDKAHSQYPQQGKVSNGQLYVTYANGSFPNQVSLGSVYKIDIATNEVKDITPGRHAFCGLDVNGDMIVASTVCFWSPEDNIYVSYDGGETWNGFWDYDTNEKNYTMDVSEAPWLYWHGEQKLGWWTSAVAINPFNTDEMLYGTGATIYGTSNLSDVNGGTVSIDVRAKGIEECAMFDLVSPSDPDGPELYSILGDLYGFRHDDVNTPPQQHFGDFACSDIAAADDAAEFVVRATKNGNKPVLYSKDSGDTWEYVATLPEGISNDAGGQVAISCDGSTVIWQPGTSGTNAYRTTDFGDTWEICEGLPINAKILADGVNPDKFYATYDGTFYISTDAGKTFTIFTSFLISSFEWVANNDVEGEIWLGVSGGGVYKLDANTKEITRTEGDCTGADAIGLGKAAEGQTQMAIYILGEANGEGWGVYQSIDGGATWKKLNDDTERWGNVNHLIVGDPKVYGRVYISTNGRGIIMGNANS